MRKKKDLYINYEHYYRKRRRRSNKTLGVIFVVLLALAITFGTYYLIKQRIHPFERNEQKDSKYAQDDQKPKDTTLIDEENSVVDNNFQLDDSSDSIENLSDDMNPEELLSENQDDEVDRMEGNDEPSPTVPTQVEDTRVPTLAKGIYVTAKSAASDKMQELIQIAKTTEINTMVIDVKDDSGKITFQMDSDMANEIGAVTNYIKDMPALIEELKKNDIYVIARIVAFKDPHLAEQRQNLALKNKDGSIYRDNNGDAWVNPYNQKVWEYLYEISAKTAAIGFDEINYDYIRFSTGKGISEVDFGQEAESKTKEDIITEFTKYIYEKLKPLGVFVSADVYGTIISSSIDAGLVGQNYVEMAKHLDYICPMIYPSHFGEGNYGVAYPDLEPLVIVRKVMNASKEKLSQIPEGEHRAKVRPWLQDFTASWVKHYQVYTGKQVREQIQGVYDAGYEEWFLWNAGSNYSVDGLLTE